jgi:hypothetical protein
MLTTKCTYQKGRVDWESAKKRWAIPARKSDRREKRRKSLLTIDHPKKLNENRYIHRTRIRNAEKEMQVVGCGASNSYYACW